jgi:hypothetical protein
MTTQRRAILAVAGLVLALGLPAARGPVSRAADEPAKAAGGEKDKERWKRLFDGKTLAGWTAAKFGEGGKAHVKGGAIVMEKGKLMSGVTYTAGGFPKMDYEVTFEGKRLSGDDFFCTVTFPVGDDFCSFVVGGWGGTVVGLSSIDGSDASENETSKYKEFKRNQWYRVRLRVSKTRIEAWIDKEKMVDLDTTDRRISIRIECRPCRPFGLATWDTAGAVRDVRVRTLTEAEKKELAKPEKKE